MPRYEKLLKDFLKGIDCKYILLTIAENGINSLLSQLVEKPDSLLKLLIRVRRGGIDACGLEMNKRISSVYSKRWCLYPSMSIGDIKGLCLILAAKGSIITANKMGRGDNLDGFHGKLQMGEKYSN